MRVAVIGIGRMGRHHVRNFFRLQKEGLVELVAISDSESKKRKIAEQYGCKFYTDYKKMIEDENLDAVSIAVPTSLHEKVTVDCLERGINVLVEKPISYSLESAERMVKTAKKNNVQLMVGHIERFNPAIQKLKVMIKEKELGEIISLDAKRLGIPKISDCGVILDLAIHDIDIMKYILEQEVVSVYAVAKNKVTPNELEDYANIVLQFDKGTMGRIEASRLTPTKIRELFVTGTKAYCKLDYLEQRLELTQSFLSAKYNSWEDFQDFLKKFKPETKIIKEKNIEPLYLELKAFINAIKNKKPVESSGEEALEALKIALAAIDSYRNGKIIRLR